MIVAHADLPHAVDLAWVADFDGVTLVPDRHDDGTNVACVPTGAGFTFAYGPGSFARHRAEAERLGLPLRVEREPHLGWDVDLPDDLATPEPGSRCDRHPRPADAGLRAGHRRPPRRHRVQRGGHAGQVVGGRVRRCTTSC